MEKYLLTYTSEKGLSQHREINGLSMVLEVLINEKSLIHKYNYKVTFVKITPKNK